MNSIISALLFGGDNGGGGGGLPTPIGRNSAYTLMCDASGTDLSIEWLPPFVITLTDDGAGNYTVDMTMQEINAAYWKGQRLIASYGSMQAELTFMHLDLYTFMFTLEGWLLQGEIKYHNTTYVEVKRSVILDATGLDDFARTPWVDVNPSTQIAHIGWNRATYTFDIVSSGVAFVTSVNFEDIAIAYDEHSRVDAYFYYDNVEYICSCMSIYTDSNDIHHLIFQCMTSEGVLVLDIDDRNGADSPGVVTPPSQYLASMPFVITLTQSAFVFTYDKTIAEIAEAYQQGRRIWLQGTVTSDGVNFFDFKSQLNGVVKVGNGGQFGNPVYTFVVEYDTRGSGVYHTVISLYTNSLAEDDCQVTAKIIQ